MTKIGTALFISIVMFMAVFFIETKAQNEKNTAIKTDSEVVGKIKQLTSPDPNQRAIAACNLKKMGVRAKAVVPTLVQLLSDDTEVNSNLMCYEDLSPSPEEDFKGLRTSSPGAAAVQALIAIGTPAVEPLIIALKDSRWQARKNAAWALTMIRDSRALEPLILSLKDEVLQVRAWAAMGLGEQRDERVVDALIASLEGEEIPQVRWFLVASLGQHPDSRIINPLLSSLKNGSHPRERAYAAASLGQIRDLQVVEPLISALRDKNAQVRMYAAASLGQLRDKRAVEPLTAALNDESQQVRFYVRESLNQIRE